MQEKLDSIKELGYNNNDNANASEPVKIDMRKQTPLNDPKCQHNPYLDTEDADSDWMTIYKCHNCPVGWAVQKQI